MMNLRFLYSACKYFLHQHAAAAAPTPPPMHTKSLSGSAVHLASTHRETIILHTEMAKARLCNVVGIIAAAAAATLVQFGASRSFVEVQPPGHARVLPAVCLALLSC